MDYLQKEAGDGKVKKRDLKHVLEEAKTCPPERIAWFHLALLEKDDPGAAARRWREAKEYALKELASGHRAAKSLAWTGSGDDPYTRARFLALRNSLIEDWKPRGAMERLLIDILAQIHTMHERWLRTATVWQVILADEQERELGKSDKNTDGPLLPRLSAAKTIEQAMGMLERWNRIFVRTLRALRDLRRYSLHIQAGQVNIAAAGGRQVNVGSDG